MAVALFFRAPARSPKLRLYQPETHLTLLSAQSSAFNGDSFIALPMACSETPDTELALIDAPNIEMDVWPTLRLELDPTAASEFWEISTPPSVMVIPVAPTCREIWLDASMCTFPPALVEMLPIAVEAIDPCVVCEMKSWPYTLTPPESEVVVLPSLSVDMRRLCSPTSLKGSGLPDSAMASSPVL